ncbi:hypothetical protein L596_019575 [Steinernema carpocapsae]|uniref:Uncharacterized protein n=1 Tax=Steinernema carpocapsae TaxID=34508 RepID=A0A4U5MQX3_STECR|nr:hypothetical protein L596_019575 [Steinernema carpocapsae]
MSVFRSLMSVATLPTSAAPFPLTVENCNVLEKVINEELEEVRSESSASSASTQSSIGGFLENICLSVFDKTTFNAS